MHGGVPDSTLARRAAAARPHQASGPGAADLAAVAVGGGIGSVARYVLSAAFPAGNGFPWAIFAVNVSGCFFLGLLMVYLLEVWPPRRFLRPVAGGRPARRVHHVLHLRRRRDDAADRPRAWPWRTPTR